jgi:hypothetical protein
LLDTYLTEWNAMAVVMRLQKSEQTLGTIQVYPDFNGGKLRIKCTQDQSVLLKEKLARNKPAYEMTLQP